MNKAMYIKIGITSIGVLLSALACGLSTPQVVTNQIECFEGKIVFSSDMDGSNEIYVMEPYCGAEHARLTNNSAEDRDPSWSPDGQQIAFVSDRTGQQEVYVMSTDGAQVEQLTKIEDIQMYVSSPTWSPDGAKLAYSVGLNEPGHALYITDADGRNHEQITNVNTALYPSWSPDGSRIVFTSDEDGDWDIYTINIDGTNLLQLTDNDVYDGRPAWSPDSQQIVFETERDGNWEIYVMNADGSDPRRITSNSVPEIQPSWSPDGQQLVYASARDGNYDIYVINVDGSNQVRLTKTTGDDGDPNWFLQDGNKE